MASSADDSSKDIIKGVICASFDETSVATARAWLPSDLSRALLEKIPELVYKTWSSNPDLQKRLAVLPIPGMTMRALAWFIAPKNQEQDGGAVQGALILLFDETNDAIFYRYIKQFEDLFGKHAAAISTLLETAADETALLEEVSAFSGELGWILDLLKTQELSPDAFPEDVELESQMPMKCKVVVLGDPAVGKTSIVVQFTEKAFKKSYLPTIGFNISEKSISHDGIPVKFMIWDVAGIAKFQQMRKNFYAGAMAVIFVFDLTSKVSLADIKGWYEDVQASIGNTFTGALLGNKCDLVDQVVISPEEASAVASELNLPYFQTSALTGENVDAVFHHFAQDFISQS